VHEQKPTGWPPAALYHQPTGMGAGVRHVKPLQPGDPQRVGRYQLLGRLGAGGMGQVFLGQSPGGRLVAVKLIRADLAADRVFRARFAREVAAARHVSGMFTAPVVDADPEAPQPWLVTAYVPGPSLADAVDGQGPLPLASVLTLAAGLAEGLGAIHAEGMVHRDLKPSNVLLASDGPRIIDFGISRAADATALTRADFVIGSPGFMSPEQALGEEVGPGSDIFSLGAVLAFAADGEGPFGAGTATALLYRVVHDVPATGRLPGRIRALVERCLAKDPRQRPTTDQFLTELGTVDFVTDWLPQPVAQTLSGYAQPVPATEADAAVPPARTLPPQPSDEPAPTVQTPPEQLPAQAPSGPAPPAADAGAPGPQPGPDTPIRSADSGAPVPHPGPGTPIPSAGSGASAGRGVSISPPGPVSEDVMAGQPWMEPVAKLADGRRPADVTAPLQWQSPPAQPRRRRRAGLALAGALVVVLAGAVIAVLASTSLGQHGGRPTSPPSSTAAGPKGVVEAYFAAINVHNWNKVWDLGGRNFSKTRSQMIAGYRMTAHDDVTDIVTHGDEVSFRLVAHQTNGSVKTYHELFVVRDGMIKAAHLTS
jgi:serine/threonine protein kinase